MRGSKNDYTFFDGLDVLYHRAKFGEDRTTRAGWRCENMVFVCLFFVYRQDAAKRRQPVFKFTQWPKISIFHYCELDRKMVDTF